MKRLNYIDYTKGLGILMIVFAHCAQNFVKMRYFNAFICTFHVPLFFMASGCLAYEKDSANILVKKFLGKRANSLIIPYIVFSIINFVIKLGILFVIGKLTKEIVSSEIVELFITGNGTVWFLITLFGVELTYLVLYKLRMLKKWGGVLCCTAALVFPYILGDVSNPFLCVIQRIIAGLGYYFCGLLMAKWFSLSYDDCLLKKRILSVILTGVAVFTYLNFGYGFSFFNNTFNKMAPSLICSISMSAACILYLYYLDYYGICNTVTKLLNYFGRNSLIIMVIHPLLLQCVLYPFGNIVASITGYEGIPISLIMYIVAVAVDIPFIWFINKYVPWIVGKNKVSI